MKDAGISLGCVVILLVINVLLGGVSTQYVVEFWGGYIKQTPVDVPFWICAVSGLFLGQFTIPLAIITWLISFVI